jgi:putrescine transport system ATP-binding protein
VGRLARRGPAYADPPRELLTRMRSFPIGTSNVFSGNRMSHGETSTRPVVVFRGVTKRFGAAAAVDRLDLEIQEGEFFALLGPSGCGKTTLLRILAGFETPTEGSVLLEGEDLAGVPPYRRSVNMMFQSYALFPHLSVARNVAFGLQQEGMPKARIAERVGEMLRVVRLEGYGDRKPDQLSGGERQRVALARSLAKRPKVLLLDEPTAALDKKLRGDTQFELMELHARFGTTFVMVTHDQEEAMTMADRIAVMERGRIAQLGTPAEIYERPASRYVADFVGDVNIIEGRLLGADLMESGWAAQMRIPAGGKEVGATVWLALRPEQVILRKTSPQPGENAIAGTVMDIGFLGNRSLVKVRTEAGKVMKALLSAGQRSQIARNDRVWVCWEAGAGVVLAR